MGIVVFLFVPSGWAALHAISPKTRFQRFSQRHAGVYPVHHLASVSPLAPLQAHVLTILRIDQRSYQPLCMRGYPYLRALGGKQ